MRRAFAFLLLPSIATAFPQEAPRTSFDFAYEISPLLAQKGCAAAKCHGGATGRGGFKLSLFSTDPVADHRAITRQLDGRRIDVLEPERSLLLRKATEDLDHGGGRRLTVGSPAYDALRSWIARGAPATLGPAQEIRALELTWNAEGNALRVHARFASLSERMGYRARDVTNLARFESTDERVATVDARGNVTRQGPGETWLIAHYAGWSARVVERHPYAEPAAQRFQKATHLDTLWHTRLAELGLTPTRPANPEALLRRLTLDLVGRFPTPRERERFLADDASTRIAQTADALLASKGFEDHWAHHLNVWFEVPEPHVDRHFEVERHTRLRQTLRATLQRGYTFTDLVREHVGRNARGGLVSRFPDPRDRAEFVGRAFLGMRLSCARCHNHPGDRWTRDQHLAWSACFADRGPTEDGMMRAAALFHPETGDPIEERLLPLSGVKPSHRPADLPSFVLDEGHRAFARNTVNRVFQLLNGHTFVEPIDDFRLANPAVHEPLLDGLTNTFLDAGYDLRTLVRTIVTLELYACSSNAETEPRAGEPEVRFLARQEPRALDPAVLQQAICRALDVPTPNAPPPRSPLAFALNTLNGDLLHGPLETPGNAIEALSDFVPDPEERLITLYTMLLTRDPRPAERQAFLDVVANDTDGSALRDLAFALLASRECGVRR
ncbi:MAG: DUF1549 domain-containing protein [Planctomycetes bacterium]|nr:DUF1549 domain-containing protein [Planctomycetota bacterium]